MGKTDADRRLRVAGKLGWFWHAHSHLSEGRARLAEALDGRSERDEHLARALSAAGALAGYHGQLAEGRPMFEEAIDIWRELGRERDLAQTLFDMGWGCFFVDDLDYRATMHGDPATAAAPAVAEASASPSPC